MPFYLRYWMLVAVLLLSCGASFKTLADPDHIQDEFGHRPPGFGDLKDRLDHLRGDVLTGDANWAPLGAMGGDVFAIAASPTDPEVVLAGIVPSGGTGGTLYRSTDGGVSWSEVPEFSGTSVYDIEFAPDGSAWLGTQNWVWSSSDDGQTWTQHDPGFAGSSWVFAVSVDPSDVSTIWAGTEGGQVINVMRSDDGGQTWVNRSPPQADLLRVRAITMDPNDSDIVIVAFGPAVAGGGVWVTEDGGQTWSNRGQGLPANPMQDVVYDGTRLLLGGGSEFNSQFAGLYQSFDLGQSWTPLHDASWDVPIVDQIAIDPNDPQTILVATTRTGVHRSTDGGASWELTIGGTEGLTGRALAFAPGSSNDVFLGVGSLGVFRSTDGGDSFVPSSDGITEMNLFSIAVNPLDASELAAAFQGLNNGGVIRSTDAGVTWGLEPLPPMRFNTVRFSGVGTLYALGEGPSSVAPEGVYRRENDGSWTRLGPDQSGTPGFLLSDLQALRISDHNPQLIMAGGRDGFSLGHQAVIWRTSDGGDNWEKVFLANESVSQFVTDIEILDDADQAMVATFTSLANNQGGALYSGDGGSTWTFSTGLPGGILREPKLCSPSGDSDSVYMALSTDIAVSDLYASNDGGETWQTTGWTASGGSGALACDPFDPDVLYHARRGQEIVARSADGGATFEPFGDGLENVVRPREFVFDGAGRLILASGIGAHATYLGEQPAAMSFTPASLDFGEVEVGTISDSMVAVLANTGGVELDGLVFTEAGSGFEADTGRCGETLAPGASCRLNITFTPESAGSAAATLEVVSTQSVGAQLALSAAGIEVVHPAIDVAPEAISLTLEQNQSGNSELTITNSGDATLNWALNQTHAALERIGAIQMEEGESSLFSAAIDPAGEFAYFAASNLPGRVVKIDLENFERVDGLVFGTDESLLRSVVIDPAGEYAYFGTGMPPGRVVKVDLETFQRVGEVTFEQGEAGLVSALIDPAGEFAYFATNPAPGRIIKVDLENFQRVGSIEVSGGQGFLQSAAMDPAGQFAYFGSGPGRVVKIDLNAFEEVDMLSLPSGEIALGTAVIDQAGEFAYFGSGLDLRVVKIDLQTFERVGSITLPFGQHEVRSAALDTAGGYVYFGTGGDPAWLAKIDLETFDIIDAIRMADGENNLHSVVMPPDGDHAFYGTYNSPGYVVKNRLRADCELPGWLSVAPANGAVDSGATQTVTVNFDATGLQPGDFEAAVCIGSDDPLNPLVRVPVTLTVEEASEPPEPPALLIPADNASGVDLQPAFSWEAAPGATEYRIQVATDTIFISNVIMDETVTDTGVTATLELEPGTEYFWRVRANPDHGPWSTIFSFTTLYLTGDLVVSPEALDFGELEVDAVATLPFVIEHAGDAGKDPLELTVIETGGDAVFAITGGDCVPGDVLAPGEHCVMEAGFSPDAQGSFEGLIRVAAVDGQEAFILLSGSGASGPVGPNDEIFRDRFEQGDVEEPAITILTGALPKLRVLERFETTLEADGGTAPYTWSASGLPGGLFLDAATGIVTNNPVRPAISGAGHYNVTFRVTDADGLTGQAVLPLSVVGIAGISVGDGHACAVADDGRGYCWGHNDTGQLGNGQVGEFQQANPLPTPIVDPDNPGQALTGLVDIAASRYHTCALTEAGTAYCWGWDAAGRLGAGTSTGDSVPVPVVVVDPADHSQPLAGATGITVGDLHACASTLEGIGYCWGDNFFGQIGAATTGNHLVPTPVVDPEDTTQPLAGVMQLGAGIFHSCAVVDNGAAWCWGWNVAGQLGNNTSTPGTAPTPFPQQVLDPDDVSQPFLGFTHIEGGNVHSCGLTEDGSAWCWGQNASGQLGNGDAPNNSLVPALVLNPEAPALTNIGPGGLHSCAVDETGQAWCWGSNFHGQLGVGDNDNRDIPTPVLMPEAADGGFTTIRTNRQHSCAVTESGIPWCWGDNAHGELGDGSRVPRDMPVPVRAAEMFTD